MRASASALYMIRPRLTLSRYVGCGIKFTCRLFVAHVGLSSWHATRTMFLAVTQTDSQRVDVSRNEYRASSLCSLGTRLVIISCILPATYSYSHTGSARISSSRFDLALPFSCIRMCSLVHVHWQLQHTVPTTYQHARSSFEAGRVFTW